MNAQQIQQTAADWVTQRVNGPWSDIDQARLQAWMDENLAHRIAYLRVESVWNEMGRLRAVGAGAARGMPPPRGASVKWVPAASDTAAEAASLPRRKVTVPRALAAGIALVAAAGAWLYLGGTSGQQRYTTKVGHIDTVELADGSNVILNTDSRIRVAIKAGERRIALEQGEAFFQVAMDPARPFIVEAGDKRVTAVGTKFSVRRVHGGVRVAVTEGAVRLENLNGKPGAPELLRAGSIARAQEDAVAIEQRPLPQAEELLSWRRGYLVFRDSPLADAVAELNRYNTRKMVIADPAIADIRIGGNFRATGTDVFLWMLKNGFPVTVEESRKEIVLRAREIPAQALQPSSR